MLSKSAISFVIPLSLKEFGKELSARLMRNSKLYLISSELSFQTPILKIPYALWKTISLSAACFCVNIKIVICFKMSNIRDFVTNLNLKDVCVKKNTPFFDKIEGKAIKRP